MNQINTVHLIIPKGHPFYCISIASYDLMSGIQVLFTWQFPHTDIPFSTSNLFKTVLGGVHRRDRGSFFSFPTSIIQVKEHNCMILSSLFTLSSSPKSLFYAISYFIKLDSVHPSASLNDALTSVITLSAVSARNAVMQNATLDLITSNVREVAIQIHFIISAGITKIPPSPPQLQPLIFSAAALSSHMQTQMTTIVELGTKDEGREFAYFLSHFLLPYQRDLSSLMPTDEVVPGLFLQVVKKQSSFPKDILWQFKRPWTWLDITYFQVIHSPSSIVQEKVYNDYRQLVLFPSKTEPALINAKIANLNDIYKLREAEPCQWATYLINKVDNLKSFIAGQYCEQKFGIVIQKAVLAIELIDRALYNSGCHLLQSKDVQWIANSLGFNDKKDFMMIICIAQIFDRKAIRRTYSDRKEIFSQMIATI